MAAFVISAARCLARIWPRSAPRAITWVVLWAGMGALLRLLLGVRRPSDMIDALCLGLFIALGLSVVFDWKVAGER